MKKIEFFDDENAFSYGGNAGWYATASISRRGQMTQDGEFYSCREDFAYDFNKGHQNLLMILGKANEFAKVRGFMRLIEKRLGLGVRSKLEFHETNKAKVILIKLSKWWTDANLRRDFLTAALRHGRYYNGNFEKALDAAPYFKDTKNAVEKFLDGHTNLGKSFSYNYDGWVETFSHDSLQYLVK